MNETAPSFDASVATTSANWRWCFTTAVASPEAAKDPDELTEVWSPRRHLCEFASSPIC